MDQCLETMRGMFEEADLDNSGTLSWEEFHNHFQDPEVQAYYRSLELDMDECDDLFELIDIDGEGSISIDEFLQGIVRLKGGARKMDQMLLMDRIQRMAQDVHH